MIAAVVHLAPARAVARAAAARSRALRIPPAALAAARRAGLRALRHGATVWGASAAAERAVIAAWHRCGCPTRLDDHPPRSA